MPRLSSFPLLILVVVVFLLNIISAASASASAIKSTAKSTASCKIMSSKSSNVASNVAYTSRPPIIYTIAGSDSGGGAGIQADLLAMHSNGCHPCTAISCITAQNSTGVTAIENVGILREQLDALYSDMPCDAVKIGMLGDTKIIECVKGWLESLPRDHKIPIVFDPVMVATSGAKLLR
jgi:hypothetical protein